MDSLLSRCDSLPPLPLDKESLRSLLCLYLLSEEQQRHQQQELDLSDRLEMDAFLHDHQRRRHALQARFEELRDEDGDLEEIERCHVKRARIAAAGVGAAISTQQSVQRRLWVKTRSKAWWERCNDPSFPESEFHESFRMSRRTFDRICEELGAVVAKEDTMLRQAIPVRQRVAVCIWRLATGEPLRLVSKRFGLGISTCHKLVLEVCAAINDVLLPKYVQWPSDKRAAAINEEFERLSGIPGVIGSIHSTHIPIIAPKVNVAAYFNRRQTEKTQKTSYSVTLQGVVDSNGVFTDVCIGWPGSLSDEQVLEKSALYQRGIGGYLEGMWVVGGPGYPLLAWLLVPYAPPHLSWIQHAFNQKAEEALKISKNAFSRLKGRWRFLQKRAEVKLLELPAILGACCVLHNICEQYQERYDPNLLYEIQDEETCAGSTSCSPRSSSFRDQMAHNLLHNNRPNKPFFL